MATLPAFPGDTIPIAGRLAAIARQIGTDQRAGQAAQATLRSQSGIATADRQADILRTFLSNAPDIQSVFGSAPGLAAMVSGQGALGTGVDLSEGDLAGIAQHTGVSDPQSLATQFGKTFKDIGSGTKLFRDAGLATGAEGAERALSGKLPIGFDERLTPDELDVVAARESGPIRDNKYVVIDNETKAIIGGGGAFFDSARDAELIAEKSGYSLVPGRNNQKTYSIVTYGEYKNLAGGKALVTPLTVAGGDDASQPATQNRVAQETAEAQRALDVRGDVSQELPNLDEALPDLITEDTANSRALPRDTDPSINAFGPPVEFGPEGVTAYPQNGGSYIIKDSNGNYREFSRELFIEFMRTRPSG